MNKDKILKNIDSLSNNAMFNISLTSKELFHTNFWAWMLRKYPSVFASVFDFEYNTNCKFEISREQLEYGVHFKIADVEVNETLETHIKFNKDIFFNHLVTQISSKLIELEQLL